MITAVLILLAVFIILLFILLIRRSAYSAQTGSGKPGKDEESRQKLCPLCGSMLEKREKVKSVVYPGEPDKLMHIFGCPRCYPEGEKRKCPACKKEIPADGYVIARVFEKPGKTHVHVLGCTGCRMG